jgi:hypothetical protein
VKRGPGVSSAVLAVLEYLDLPFQITNSTF